MLRDELGACLDTLLEAGKFCDYCPNGLQVEGRKQVQKVICGVTASQALLEAAIERQADAILVHHGWFWKGESGCVTGFRKRRLASLLKHDISLYAYHLPLDAHGVLGNNAQLAKLMGWQLSDRFAEQNIGFIGTPGKASTVAEIASGLETLLQRKPLLIGDGQRNVSRLAWCSGGAQGLFEQAVQLGADLYISGEISEPVVHLARETGVAYLAAGHHATERFGVMALAEYLRRQHGLSCEFVDIDNPV